tara:strand:- start:539 stop:802 length:264 start_codon:yes stop_codon:yes gene_type:complete
MIKDMTEDQMKELINGLAEELVKRIYGVQNVREDETTWYADRDDDHAVGELARLMTLLNIYQDREEYEKCHLINKHIKRLEKIVENL